MSRFFLFSLEKNFISFSFFSAISRLPLSLLRFLYSALCFLSNQAIRSFTCFAVFSIRSRFLTSVLLNVSSLLASSGLFSNSLRVVDLIFWKILPAFESYVVTSSVSALVNVAVPERFLNPSPASFCQTLDFFLREEMSTP